MFRLLAGMETTATTLKWSVYLLAKKPSIQEKVFKEICEVLGAPPSQRVPTLADRKHLPFTEAVLAEVQRWSSIVAVPPHRATADVTVGCYHIPKEAIVVPNLLAGHRDDRIWPNANDFDAANFYDVTNNTTKNMEYLIPFSIGTSLYTINFRFCFGFLFVFINPFFRI